MNGVLLNVGENFHFENLIVCWFFKECEDYGLGEYVTIHITPEPEFSYVSFESNVPATSYLNIVTDVLNTFNLGKFILTIFATKVCFQYT